MLTKKLHKAGTTGKGLRTIAKILRYSHAGLSKKIKTLTTRGVTFPCWPQKGQVAGKNKAKLDDGLLAL